MFTTQPQYKNSNIKIKNTCASAFCKIKGNVKDARYKTPWEIFFYAKDAHY